MLGSVRGTGEGYRYVVLNAGDKMNDRCARARLRAMVFMS